MFASGLQCCDFAADISVCAPSLAAGLSRHDPGFATHSTVSRWVSARRFAVANLYSWRFDHAVRQPQWWKSARPGLSAHSRWHSALLPARWPWRQSYRPDSTSRFRTAANRFRFSCKRCHPSQRKRHHSRSARQTRFHFARFLRQPCRLPNRELPQPYPVSPCSAPSAPTCHPW